MALNIRNQTGSALTLFSGKTTLMVLANNQLGTSIPNSITNVKLGNSATVYSRTQGNFVDGNSYTATFNVNVIFQDAGVPDVVFG